MDLETIIEHISLELVLEGLAAIFGIRAFYYLFFEGGLSRIISTFATVLCG